MATRLVAYTAATAVTISNLSTLATGTLSAAGAVDNTTNKYMDYLVEVVASVGTTASNKQYRVFVQSSVDGTNFGDSTQLTNLVEIMPPVQTPTSSTTYRSQAGSVAAAFGGYIPPKFNIYVYNDSGAAFTAGTCQWVGVTETIA